MERTANRNRLGFSPKGLVILLLVLLPNFLFYVLVMNGMGGSGTAFENSYAIIGYLEHASQVLLMLILIFRVNPNSRSWKSKYVIGMAVFLMLYYALWIRYFTGGMDYTLISGSFPVYMGMALFPAVYFGLAEKWQGDYWGVGMAVTFGVFHTLNTFLNFAM